MSAAVAELPAEAPSAWAAELPAILARLAAIEARLGIARPDADTAEATGTETGRACRVCGRSFRPRHPGELDCSLGCRRDSRRRRNRRWWHGRGRAGRKAAPAPAAVSAAPALAMPKPKPACYSCGAPSRQLIERLDPDSFTPTMVPYCGRC